MQNHVLKRETPVIFRKTDKDGIIALLPTVAVDGISTACAAYSIKHGLFVSDIGLMHSTLEATGIEFMDTLWSLCNNQPKLTPVNVFKRICEWMNKKRLSNQLLPEYRLVA